MCWNIPASKLELELVIPPACVLSKPSGVNLLMFVLVSSEQTFSYCTRPYRYPVINIDISSLSQNVTSLSTGNWIKSHLYFYILFI